MSVAVWYPHLVRMDDDGRVIVGRCVQQAAAVIATRNVMLNGITTGVSGLRSVEWQPRLLYLQGRDVALGLAAESLQAVEHVVDVLLASFHGSFRRGHDTPKLLLMTPHNDTHDSVCRHFIGGQVDEAWPDLLQDVLLLMAGTPLLVEAHDAKEKARATSQAIDARFQSCLLQLQHLTHDERLAYLQQITPAKVREYRLSRPTLFSQYLECTNTVKATGMTGTVSVVIIGKDSRFLHYGSEAEARFNVSLTRAKALTVVLAPPSATGPLGMLQTASARLFGRLDMASVQKSAEPVATLFGLCSGLADLDEHSWHGAHHIGHAAPWKELPLALSLKRRDSEEPLLLALRLDGLGPKTSRDLSVFCYQEIGGDVVLSFTMLDDQLVLHGPMGAFPVGSAWETTEAVQCGDASLWASCFSGRPRPWRMGMTSVKVRPGPVWPAFQETRLASLGRARGWRPRGVRPRSRLLPGVEWRPRLPPPADRAASVWDSAPVTGGPVAGEAYSAWPAIEQGQQSLAHPRKPLITVSDIEGLPSAARAQWPDVSADILTRVSKYLTFVTRHDPKTPATVEGFVLLESAHILSAPCEILPVKACRSPRILWLLSLTMSVRTARHASKSSIRHWRVVHSGHRGPHCRPRPYPPSPSDAA